MKNSNSKRGGFTLVELMVAVAIIGLLATVVTVSVISQKEGADRVRVQADMKVIGDALDLFKLNLGYYPNSLEELNTRLRARVGMIGSAFADAVGAEDQARWRIGVHRLFFAACFEYK